MAIVSYDWAALNALNLTAGQQAVLNNAAVIGKARVNTGALTVAQAKAVYENLAGIQRLIGPAFNGAKLVLEEQAKAAAKAANDAVVGSF